ncbi:MAG: glycoside hydrolase family 16 protein [Actinomycetales bacterium]|nr:glycoside hydrolase family 16 protein [Actinomycetales bacterium]
MIERPREAPPRGEELRLVLDERFLGLDPDRWVPHYLPHWTTPERSRARFRLTNVGLELRIEHDQAPWRDEDGPLRVSNLQTATFSGQLGSSRGTHRHRADGLLVRTATPTRHLLTLVGGRVEVTASATRAPGCMLGLWLVGVEDADPRDAGEICLVELFADRIEPRTCTVLTGVKAHHDDRLVTSMHEIPLEIDACQPHVYAAEWGRGGVCVTVDDDEVFSTHQVLDYPLQLMLSLFELERGPSPDPRDYPRSATIHRVRAFVPQHSGGSTARGTMGQ